MKKQLFSLLTGLMFCVLLLLPQRAEAAGISFSGSGSLRAGNSVTVTFSVSGSNIYAVEAVLSYDSSSLELLGTKQLIGGSWSMDMNGSKIILNDTKLSNPINSSTGVFSVTFRVKSGVSAGSKVSAGVSNVVVSNGESDTSLGGASWSAKILASLSGDASLKSLTCSNAELSFNGGTEYRLIVPYSVTSLSLDWTRSHSGADVSVSGNSLSVGDNTVTVTVTAENGNTKRYYLYVTRQQDPNYVPSSDASLASLSVAGGTLSPAFSPEISEYVVYLPNETAQVQLSASAKDSKAQSVRQVGSSKHLAEGETLIFMRCVAEDGTQKDYRVHVVRMPAYAGVLPEIIAPEAAVADPVEPDTAEPEKPAVVELPLVIDLPYVGEVPSWWLGAGALAVLVLLVWLIAWAVGRRGGRKKALRQMAVAQGTGTEAGAPTAESAGEAEQSDSAAENSTSAAPEPSAAEEAENCAAEKHGEEPAAAAQDMTMSDEEAAEKPVLAAAAEEELNTAAPVEPAEEAPADEAPAGELPEEQETVQDVPAGEPLPQEVPEERTADVDPAEERADDGETKRGLQELGGMSLDELLEDIRNM